MMTGRESWTVLWTVVFAVALLCFAVLARKHAVAQHGAPRQKARTEMMFAFGQTASPPKSADIKPALDRLLAPVLDHGTLAPATGGGLVIGILDHGVGHIYAYGTAKENSIFEIGSVTKTFTGLPWRKWSRRKKSRSMNPCADCFRWEQFRNRQQLK